MRAGQVHGAVAALTSAALVSLAVASFAQSAAEAEPEPIAVAYRAPEGCPDETSFLREITARTQRARPARAGERARVMRVTISSALGRYAGRFWIEDERGSSSAREVSSASCAELVRALGLVAALAVDPRASTAPRIAETASTAPGEASTPGAAGATTSPDAGPPIADASAPASEPGTGATRGVSDAAAPPREASPSQPLGVGVGVGGEIAMVADVVPSLRLFGDLAFRSDGAFAPSGRLAIARSLEIERSPAIGRASMTFTTAALDVCPFRFDLARPVHLRPCAGIGGGFLAASGAGVDAPADRTRPWLAATATGRLVWAPWSALGLEAEAGAIFPFFRESFLFQPNVPIYRAPPAALLGRIGVAVHLR